jgi:hypothetical protein
MEEFLSKDYYLHDDPRMAKAWAPWFSHEYITYFTVQSAEDLMGLPPVPVRPNPCHDDESWPIGPRHIDLYKESYQEVRQQDPFLSFDYGWRDGEYSAEPPIHATIEPWKVLVLYSTEPDLKPDYDLFLHKLEAHAVQGFCPHLWHGTGVVPPSQGCGPARHARRQRLLGLAFLIAVHALSGRPGPPFPCKGGAIMVPGQEHILVS